MVEMKLATSQLGIMIGVARPTGVGIGIMITKPQREMYGQAVWKSGGEFQW
jgi:hypothetical protein